MRKILKYRPLILALVLLVISVCFFLHWNNTALQVTEYDISSSGLPASFDGYKIVQISDLHNTEFGKDNSRLINKIREQAPDIIVITGDIVDSRRTNVAIALSFVREAAAIAPVYYVPGNHESRIDHDTLFADLREAGAVTLLNDVTALKKGNDTLSLIGIKDPTFYPDHKIDEMLLPLMPEEGYTIVLSHRPEELGNYALCGADLVFTGHVHGGQFRFPFIGGLYSPGQGLFPKYDAGVFTEGKTQMIVSRGLGNSAFPFRLFNRPEIVVVTLKNTK